MSRPREATKACSPPPLSLVAIGTFFLTLKKNHFSLVEQPFSPPPLLVARPLRIELFLCLPLGLLMYMKAFLTVSFD